MGLFFLQITAPPCRGLKCSVSTSPGPKCLRHRPLRNTAVVRSAAPCALGLCPSPAPGSDHSLFLFQPAGSIASCPIQYAVTEQRYVRRLSTGQRVKTAPMASAQRKRSFRSVPHLLSQTNVARFKNVGRQKPLAHSKGFRQGSKVPISPSCP